MAQEAPERYAILVKYRQTDEFVPVPSGWGKHGKTPDGGYFLWEDAVELMERMRHSLPLNEYMIMPVIADPI